MRRITVGICILLVSMLLSACMGDGDDDAPDATPTAAVDDDVQATADRQTAADVLATTVTFAPAAASATAVLPIIDAAAPAEEPEVQPESLLLDTRDVPADIDLTGAIELTRDEIPLPHDGIVVGWRRTSLSPAGTVRYDAFCVQYNTTESAIAALEIHQSWAADPALTSYEAGTIEPLGDYSAIGSYTAVEADSAMAWLAVGPVACVYTIEHPEQVPLAETAHLVRSIHARVYDLPPPPTPDPATTAGASGSPAGADASPEAETVSEEEYLAELHETTLLIAEGFVRVARILEVPEVERATTWPSDTSDEAWHIESWYTRLTEPGAPLSIAPSVEHAELHDRLLEALETHHASHAIFLGNQDLAAYEDGFIDAASQFNAIMLDIVAAAEGSSAP